MNGRHEERRPEKGRLDLQELEAAPNQLPMMVKSHQRFYAFLCDVRSDKTINEESIKKVLTSGRESGMNTNRKSVATVSIGFIFAFLFFVPVIRYGIPPGVYNCPANGCDFPRYGSVTYWGLGVGGVWTYRGSYSILVVTSSVPFSVGTSVSTSYYVSSQCIGPTTVSAMLNDTSTTIQTCSVSQLVLDAQGCYIYSSGATLCVRGAPLNSLADLYGNGTIIVTYPSGYTVSCDPGDGTGPCVVGIP